MWARTPVLALEHWGIFLMICGPGSWSYGGCLSLCPTPAVILVCPLWSQILIANKQYFKSVRGGTCCSCGPCACTILDILSLLHYNTHPAVLASLRIIFHVCNQWGQVMAVAVVRHGHDRDNVSMFVWTSSVVWITVLGWIKWATSLRNHLTLNVFLLNFRKLFVGGLDWSTTQGRCHGWVPGVAARLTLVFKLCCEFVSCFYLRFL